jgi:hypothetical protein
LRDAHTRTHTDTDLLEHIDHHPRWRQLVDLG